MRLVWRWWSRLPRIICRSWPFPVATASWTTEWNRSLGNQSNDERLNNGTRPTCPSVPILDVDAGAVTEEDARRLQLFQRDGQHQRGATSRVESLHLIQMVFDDRLQARAVVLPDVVVQRELDSYIFLAHFSVVEHWNFYKMKLFQSSIIRVGTLTNGDGMFKVREP